MGPVTAHAPWLVWVVFEKPETRARSEWRSDRASGDSIRPRVEPATPVDPPDPHIHYAGSIRGAYRSSPRTRLLRVLPWPPLAPPTRPAASRSDPRASLES